VIARDGQPVARLVPLRPRRQSREPGIWRGLVSLAPDFDEPDEALLDSFEQ
jgi:antitoxin (DNA-binding transcriptional repressor) of toxin-antitoxin stability system